MKQYIFIINLSILPMPPKPPSYIGSFFAYQAMITLPFLLALGLIGSLGEHYLKGSKHDYLTGAVAISVIILYFFPLLFKKAALHRVLYSYGYWAGLKSALMEWKVLLALLPVVGFLPGV